MPAGPGRPVRRRRRLAVRLGLIALLLIGTVPAGVAAQGSPRHVLLDADATRIAEVHTDGQTYVVFAVENRLPFASGVEVYADGRRVTDPATVDAVFQALARGRGRRSNP